MGVFNNDKLYFQNQLLPLIGDYKQPKPRKKGQKKKGKKTKGQLLKDKYGDDIIVKLLILLLGKERGRGDKETKKKTKLDTGFKGMRRVKGGGGNFASASQVRGQRAEAEKKAKEDKAKAAIAIAAIPLPGEDEEDTAARVTAVKIASTDDPVQKVLYELTGGMTLPKIQGLHGSIAYLGQFVEPLLNRTLTTQQRSSIEREVLGTVVGFKGGEFEKKFKPDFTKGKDTEIKRGAREGDLRVRTLLQQDITGSFAPPPATATATAPPPSYGQPPSFVQTATVVTPKPRRSQKLDTTTKTTPPVGGGILGAFGIQPVAVSSPPIVTSSPEQTLLRTIASPSFTGLSLGGSLTERTEPVSFSLQPSYFSPPLSNLVFDETQAIREKEQLLNQQAFEEEAQLREAIQQSQATPQPYIARRIPQSSVSTTNTISDDEREAISNRQVARRPTSGEALVSRVFSNVRGRRREEQRSDPSLQEISTPYVDAIYQDVLNQRGLEQIQQTVTDKPPKEEKQSKDEKNIFAALNTVASYDWDELPIGRAVTAKGKPSRTKPITDLEEERQQLEDLIRGSNNKAPSRLLQIVERSMSKLALGQSLITGERTTKKEVKLGTAKGAFDRTDDGVQVRATGKEERIADYFPAWDELKLKEEQHLANTDEGRRVREKLKSIRTDFEWGMRDKVKGAPQSRDGFTDNTSITSISDAQDAYGYDLPESLGEFGNELRIRSGERIIGAGPQGIGVMMPSGLVRYISALGKTKQTISASKYTSSLATLQKLEGKRGLSIIQESQVERARKNVDDYEKVQQSKEPQVEGVYEVSTTDPSDTDEPKSASAYRNNKKIIKAVNKKIQKGESLTKNESDRYALAVRFNTEFKTARDANAEAQAQISAISGGAGQTAAGSSTEGFYTNSDGSEYGVPYSELAEHAQRRFGDDIQGQKDYKMDKFASYVPGEKIKSKGRRREEKALEKLQLQKEGQAEQLRAQLAGESFIDDRLVIGGGDFTQRQQENVYVKKDTAKGRGDSGHNIIMRGIAEETDPTNQSKLRNSYGEILRKYAKEKIIRDSIADGQSGEEAQENAIQLDYFGLDEIVAQADDLLGSTNLQVDSQIYKRISKDWKKVRKGQAPPKQPIAKVAEPAEEQTERVRELELEQERQLELEQESELTSEQVYQQAVAEAKADREELAREKRDKKLLEELQVSRKKSGSSSGSSSSSGRSISDLGYGSEISESESSSSEDLPQPPAKKGKSLDWWEKKARQYRIDNFEDNLKSSQGIVMRKAQDREYHMDLKKEAGRDDIRKVRVQNVPGWGSKGLIDELKSKGVKLFGGINILTPEGTVPSHVTDEDQKIPFYHKYRLDVMKKTDWYRDNVLNAPTPDFSDYVLEGQAQDAERLQEFQQEQARKTATKAPVKTKRLIQAEDLVYKKGRERKVETGFALPQTITGTQPVFEDESLEVGQGGLDLLGQTLEIQGGTVDAILGKGEFNIESDDETF